MELVLHASINPQSHLSSRLVYVYTSSSGLRLALGIPIIVRTIKSLVMAGAQKIFLIGKPDDISTQVLKKYGVWDLVTWIPDLKEPMGNSLVLLGGHHYDPDFIKELFLGNMTSSSQAPSHWHGLVDETEIAIKKVSQSLFKNIKNKTDGLIAPTINKPISFRLTEFLLATPLTPNMITVINMGIAVLAGFLLASTHYTLRFIGALLMTFSSILDGCDGEVAKLRFQFSKIGGWLDTIADDVANNAFFIGLFVGIYRTTGNPVYMKIGGFFLILSVGVSLIIYHQLLTKKESTNAKDFKPEIKNISLFEKLRPLMKRDFFIFLLTLFVILDFRKTIFAVACVATAATFFTYVVSFVNSLKKAPKAI